MSDLRYINRALAALAIALALFFALSLASASASTSSLGRQVTLTRTAPHQLTLRWGTTLVGYWYVRCVPTNPHVVRVVTTQTQVLVDLWYCGAVHRKGWMR